MAAPTRLSLINPLRTWVWVSLILGAVLFIFFLMLGLQQIKDELQLTNTLSQTIIKTHALDLRSGNYRRVIEGIGEAFPNLLVSISTPTNSYEYASQPARAWEQLFCADPIVIDTTKVTLCQHAFNPYLLIPVAVLVIFLFSFLILRQVKYLENKAVLALKELMSSVGLPAGQSNDLFAVLSEMSEIKKRLDEVAETNKEKQRLQTIVEIATQVAHDIRSPIAALSHKSILSDPIAARAIQRINEIADDLLVQRRAILQNQTALFDILKTSEYSATMLLETILDEKLLEYKDQHELLFVREYTTLIKTDYISVNANTFLRILSNILNNAAEAMAYRGKVTVITALVSGDKILIKVSDTGPGIPPEVKKKLFSPGFTYGKEKGSGLGLSNARDKINSWGGTIDLNSTINKGTEVLITLPLARDYQTANHAILIDDDKIVRDLWIRASKQSNIQLSCYSSTFEIEAQLEKINHSTPIYIDSNLTVGPNGETFSKILSEKGFTELYLTTGYPKSAYPQNWRTLMPWVRDILGKAPPWNI